MRFPEPEDELVQVRPRVALFGNFLSAHRRQRFACEDLADRLETRQWAVVRSSTRVSRLARLLDMVRTARSGGRGFDVAVVDVFSGPSLLWSYAVAVALRAAGCPAVACLRGGRLPEFAEGRRRLFRSFLHKFSSVASPSRYLAHTLAAYRDDIAVIDNGIDLARFELRLRGPCSPHLVWLRSYHEAYRPAVVPATVAGLLGAYPGVRARMTGGDKGDGSKGRTLREVARLGLEARVEVGDGVPFEQVPGFLAGGDVFLNTTAYESFGVGVMQAGACGLCIVSSAVGEIPYRWRDGHSALLVNEDRPEAYADAVARILRDAELARRLSANAREVAVASDWPKVLDRWEGILSSAVAERGGNLRECRRRAAGRFD